MEGNWDGKIEGISNSNEKQAKKHKILHTVQSCVLLLSPVFFDHVKFCFLSRKKKLMAKIEWAKTRSHIKRKHNTHTHTYYPVILAEISAKNEKREKKITVGCCLILFLVLFCCFLPGTPCFTHRTLGWFLPV